MANVDFPAQLRPLLARIETLARGARVDAYVVGGSVRDAVLGRPMYDLDLAVSGDALAFARTLADALSGSFVTLDDENSVARIVLEPAMTLALAHVDVAALQGDVEADLRRRDVTINALAVPIGASSLIDVCGGLDDLARRVVRMNGARAFADDPLRMLRAARIASELGFEIDSATAEVIRAAAAQVLDAAPERQHDEFVRIFGLEDAGAAVRLLDALGLLDVLLPEVGAGRGIAQPAEFHAYDVFGHALAAVDAMDVLCARSRPGHERAWMWDVLWDAFAWDAGRLRAYVDERAPLLKLAALLHDVAKPQTRTVDGDGRIRFLGHADEGARVATTMLRRLRFSLREMQFVTTLVREHLRPVQLAPAGEAPTARALYRFHREVGEAFEGVLLVSLADGAAAAGARLTHAGWSRQVAYMNSLIVRLQGEGGIVHAPRLLTGRDIMAEFGLAEGPRIGSLLEAVREAQAVGEVHDRESALTFVRARLT